MEPVEPWVYAWPQSVVAGDHVGLRVAGPACRGRVQIARIGARREVVWNDVVDVVAHDIPDDADAAGCRWPDAVRVEVPASWRSGYYEVTVRTDVGARHEAVGFFVVRAAERDPTRPLMVLTTNTWNAYNDFGGKNLYTGGTHASFERPMTPGFLRKPDGPGSRVAVVDAPDRAMAAHIAYLRDHRFSPWAGSAGWPNAELGFVRWAEAAGYGLDYAVNGDLETVPDLLAGRRLYLSVGHDEYWSAPMRDAVEDFVADGGNAVFLSGNTCFWQVRLEEPDATGRPGRWWATSSASPATRSTAPSARPSCTSLWSDHLIGRPENQLTGVSFSRGGYHRIGRVGGQRLGGLHRLPARPLGVRRDRGGVRRRGRRRRGDRRLRVRRLRLHHAPRAALPDRHGRHPRRLRDPGHDPGPVLRPRQLGASRPRRGPYRDRVPGVADPGPSTTPRRWRSSPTATP